jgi:hypothetical protein
LVITLAIEAQTSTIGVSRKRSALANSDPNYLALRTGAFKTSYRVENVILERDLGRLTLRSGAVDFLAPVLDRVVIGVFAGEGEFQFKPSILPEVSNMSKVTGKDEVNEAFKSAVLLFTNATYGEIVKAGKKVDGPVHGSDALREFRSRMRRRADEPRSRLEALLGGEHVVNIEAELLADLYDTSTPGVFAAYMHGKKHQDLRFIIHPRGAVPSPPSAEEVALINVEAEGEQEGITCLTKRRNVRMAARTLRKTNASLQSSTTKSRPQSGRTITFRQHVKFDIERSLRGREFYASAAAGAPGHARRDGRQGPRIHPGRLERGRLILCDSTAPSPSGREAATHDRVRREQGGGEGRWGRLLPGRAHELVPERECVY